MNLKVKDKKYMEQEKLDALVRLYTIKKISYRCFIDCVIDHQKKLIINDLCRPQDGAVFGEVIKRRMEHAGIEITI